VRDKNLFVLFELISNHIYNGAMRKALHKLTKQKRVNSELGIHVFSRYLLTACLYTLATSELWNDRWNCRKWRIRSRYQCAMCTETVLVIIHTLFHNYRTPWLLRHNLVNIQFIYTKIFRSERKREYCVKWYQNLNG